MTKRPKGRYRTFVFILSAEPTLDDNKSEGATLPLARLWASGGLPFLPDEKRKIHLSRKHRIVARVYEFEQEDKGNSKVVQSSRSVFDHLMLAGIDFGAFR